MQSHVKCWWALIECKLLLTALKLWAHPLSPLLLMSFASQAYSINSRDIPLTKTVIESQRQALQFSVFGRPYITCFTILNVGRIFQVKRVYLYEPLVRLNSANFLSQCIVLRTKEAPKPAGFLSDAEGNARMEHYYIQIVEWVMSTTTAPTSTLPN